ncbi:MAG: hypothetical protein V2A76_14605 [Planctomycetota bacterium]
MRRCRIDLPGTFLAIPLFALCALVFSCSTTRPEPRGRLPDGYWSEQQTREVLDRTLEVRFDPDLSGLSEAERATLGKLLEVGEIFQELYERTKHHQALSAHRELIEQDRRLASPLTRDLLDLYRLFEGPIATTLDNQRLPFLPVDPEVPGKNVYPIGLKKEALADASADLLRLRSVVRRVDAALLSEDLATLRQYPVLDTLHPGLAAELSRLRTDPDGQDLYAVPYSVAFASELLKAFLLLNEAAALIESTDPDFSDYLRQRARDLLADDYEAGDAAWVTGRFGKLNAQLGAYETYDDALFGVKAFFGASLLLLDEPRSEELRSAISGLQRIEDALPARGTGRFARGFRWGSTTSSRTSARPGARTPRPSCRTRRESPPSTAARSCSATTS